MRENNLISVITVCYNAKETIKRTIQSVINQTFKKYEYIIIDGNSSDGTLGIINTFLANHKITVVSEPDQGIYDAMNKALALAKGEYVLFLNAGDELARTSTLDEIFLIRTKPDLIYGETIIIDSQRKELGTRTELTSRKLPLRLLKKDFLNGQVVSHQSFVPKRKLTSNYDLKYQCSADIEWMLNVMDKAKTVHLTEKPISIYLKGGISDTQLRICWKERFMILMNHFNPIVVLWQHLIFIIRFLKIGAYRT